MVEPAKAKTVKASTPARALPTKAEAATAGKAKAATANDHDNPTVAKSDVAPPPKKKRSLRSWQENFDKLVEYKAKTGESVFPPGYVDEGGFHIARWTDNQRKSRAILKEKQRKALDAIGFIWDPLAHRWDAMFERMKGYHALNGNCQVNQRSGDNTDLARWVKKQRESHKNGWMAEGRKERLDTINFNWGETKVRLRNNPCTEKWVQMYEKLTAFQKENGHCNVQRTYAPDPPLGYWVKAQRDNYSRTTLSDERIEKLQSIGFIWNTKLQPAREKWNKMYVQLEAYKQENGHTSVPKRGGKKETTKLAAWIEHQQYLANTGKLAASNQAMLDLLGVDLQAVGEKAVAPPKGPDRTHNLNLEVSEAAANLEVKANDDDPDAYGRLSDLILEMSGLLDALQAEGDQSVQQCENFLEMKIKKARDGRAGTKNDIDKSDTFSRLMPLVDTLMSLVDTRKFKDAKDVKQCETFLSRALKKAKKDQKELTNKRAASDEAILVGPEAKKPKVAKSPNSNKTITEMSPVLHL